MGKVYRVVLWLLVLSLFLSGCGNKYKLFEANVIREYQASYTLAEKCDFILAESEVADVIVDEKLDKFDVVCIESNDGNIYAAYKFSNEKYNCFLNIGDSFYPYRDTIAISKYSHILNHDGFILSFVTGANSNPILYFYMESGVPVLLAECDKSSYELNGGEKLLTNYGSVMSITEIYYIKKNKMYKVDLNDFISELLCENGESVSIIYNRAGNMFEIDIYGNDLNTAVSSKTAHIDGDFLYIK